MDYLKTIDDLSIKMGVNIILGDKIDFTKKNKDQQSTDKGTMNNNDPTHPNSDIELNEKESFNNQLFYPFKLPIQYQPPSTTHMLSQIVISDLELDKSDNQTPIYDFLFQPSHDFSKKMTQEWKKNISSDPLFLKETQEVIQNMPFLSDYKNEIKAQPVNTTQLTSIWSDIKNDPHFLEKYSYMEFDFFKYLNYSETFLQTVTFANIVSPIASLLFPIIVMILPFLILNVQRTNFEFSKYVNVLKDLAKNHFIGKTIINLENMDYTKVGYMAVSLIMYLLQIYNNIITCFHFYRNIQKINDDLINLREFIHVSTSNMEAFVKLNNKKKTYSEFCNDIMKYSDILKEMEDCLLPITPFSVSLNKLTKVGYMLKCYYQLYSIEKYTDALQFSFGFEGYIDGMRGVFDNLSSGAISLGSIELDGKSENTEQDTRKLETSLKIKDQYYPPHSKENAVKNSIILGESPKKKQKSAKEGAKEADVSPTSAKEGPKEGAKGGAKGGDDLATPVKEVIIPNGIIITGPNASGKTTFLKTTAINIIFTQQLGVGYYSSCSLKPYHNIHSYLNIPDTSGRDSLFQAEARRCKEIIDSIQSEQGNNTRHFCIFDELYSGTNPTEASKASFSFLKYLSGFDNIGFMLTTHYSCVCKRIIKENMYKIANHKMRVIEKPVENGENEIIYTYQLEKGISKVEGAINVLKSLNYPKEILNYWALLS